MEIVWQGQMDDRYDCKVVRTSEYKGQLIVEDMFDRTTILDEPVGLSYGAIFGPDVSDVAAWQDRVIEVVDGE